MSQASLFTSTHEQACKEFTMKGSVGKVRDALGFPPCKWKLKLNFQQMTLMMMMMVALDPGLFVFSMQCQQCHSL